MAKALLWDVETAPMVGAIWSLRPKDFIPHQNILRDWFIICGAWKWLDGKRVYSTACDPADIRAYFCGEGPPPDRLVVERLREAVEQADFIIAHNGDGFDLRKLNARIIHYGLPALPSVRTVDTLKEARKVAAFSSNRLDFLAKTLTDGGKLQTEPGLWLRVLRGQRNALNEMLRYNRRDVTELEDVYRYLLPYMKAHPNVTVGDPTIGLLKKCPKCSSTNLQRRGKQKTQTQVYDRYHCQDCGSWSRASRITGRGVLKPSAGRHP